MSDDPKEPKPPRIRKDGQPDRRCPPKKHRFQPGRSGNPTGKRRRSKSVADDVEALLSRLIKVRRGDTEEVMTTQQAALHAVLQKAIARGDYRPLMALIDLLPPPAPADDTAQRKDLSAKLVALLNEAATAKKNGAPFWPPGCVDDAAKPKK